MRIKNSMIFIIEIQLREKDDVTNIVCKSNCQELNVLILQSVSYLLTN